MSRATALDDGQYSRHEILKYEAIYGRDFISPGGLDSARRFIARLGLTAGARVLDAGCGIGGSAYEMATGYGARVTGIDLSANMIALARERCAAHGLAGQVTFVHGDCLALDAAGAFDAVYSRDAFLHVHDKARLFAVLHAALAPGGRLLITDYCAAPPPWSEGFTAYVRERGYDLHPIADYVALLEGAGFVDTAGEDLSAEFAAIHEAELARLPGAGLDAADAAELAAGWQAKLDRIRAGEQRWGLFTARRGGDTTRR